MTQIPTLITKRLVLRASRFEDWPEYCELMMSERAQYMGGPFSQEGAWGWFTHGISSWSLFGHGALMIEDRATSRCLGEVGINEGPLFPEREIGWTVYKQAEGNGIAYEAANALLDWAFTDRGLDTLVSYVDPKNLRSCRLAERLGAKIDRNAPAMDATDLVYRHKNKHQ